MLSDTQQGPKRERVVTYSALLYQKGLHVNQSYPPNPKEKSQEIPVMHIKTAEYLSLTGWQIVLNWLEKNAPKDIYHLAQDLTFFDYYQVSILRTGKIDADTNQAVGERLIDITNRISALQEW